MSDYCKLCEVPYNTEATAPHLPWCPLCKVLPPQPAQPSRAREWFAYFHDHKDLSQGLIQMKMLQGMSNNAAELKVVEKSAYDALMREAVALRDALQLIAIREVKPFVDGIDPNSSLGLSIFADEALAKWDAFRKSGGG